MRHVKVKVRSSLRHEEQDFNVGVSTTREHQISYRLGKSGSEDDEACFVPPHNYRLYVVARKRLCILNLCGDLHCLHHIEDRFLH